MSSPPISISHRLFGDVVSCSLCFCRAAARAPRRTRSRSTLALTLTLGFYLEQSVGLGEGTCAVTPNRKVNHSLFLILQKQASTYWRNLFFIWCYGSPEERLWPRLHGEKSPWSSSRVTLPAELTLVTAGSQQCMRILWLSRLHRVDPAGWAKVFPWRKVGLASRVFPLHIIITKCDRPSHLGGLLAVATFCCFNFYLFIYLFIYTGASGLA